MNIIEIKNKFFDLFVNKIDTCNNYEFEKSMEFLEMMLHDYKRSPERTIDMLKNSNKHNFSINSTPQIPFNKNSLSTNDKRTSLSKSINMSRRVSILPGTNQIQIEENYQEEYHQQNNQQNNQQKINKNCALCKRKPSYTYRYGPGLCHTCRNFYCANYPKKERLVCSNRKLCLETREYMYCNSCKLEKCEKAGLKWVPIKHRNEKSVSNVPVVRQSGNEMLQEQSEEKSQNEISNCNSLSVVQAKANNNTKKFCIVCRSVKNVGRNRYGTCLCINCASWYCRIRNDESRKKALVCVNKSNKCDDLPGSAIVFCRKCKLNKIQQFATC
ncbi:unnamed protein product [Brachionus calyciflorus]|uniref:Nuclear receptor domain-containing protein n=1 Tax=Brachionus calyciflorus TaxID=104777 RepID=A0A814C6U4_9BILA|nr:unnamed protein product [Brachionus calyciflorus]